MFLNDLELFFQNSILKYTFKKIMGIVCLTWITTAMVFSAAPAESASGGAASASAGAGGAAAIPELTEHDFIRVPSWLKPLYELVYPWSEALVLSKIPTQADLMRYAILARRLLGRGEGDRFTRTEVRERNYNFFIQQLRTERADIQTLMDISHAKVQESLRTTSFIPMGHDFILYYARSIKNKADLKNERKPFYCLIAHFQHLEKAEDDFPFLTHNVMFWVAFEAMVEDTFEHLFNLLDESPELLRLDADTFKTAFHDKLQQVEKRNKLGSAKTFCKYLFSLRRRIIWDDTIAPPRFG